MCMKLIIDAVHGLGCGAHVLIVHSRLFLGKGEIFRATVRRSIPK